MYVSEDVEAWFNVPDLLEEGEAAEIHVEVGSWGRVGDEDVCTSGNAILPWRGLAVVLKPMIPAYY